VALLTWTLDRCIADDDCASRNNACHGGKISLMPVAIILRWVGLCGDDVCEHDQPIASLSFELN